MSNNVLFSFTKPSAGSTVATNRLALFIEQHTGMHTIADASIADTRPDVLFIINGAFAFCDHLEALAVAIQRAPRIVWVQQDYTIVPPSPTATAESPFRKAFQLRRGEPMHWWTTVKRNAQATDRSKYCNWNSVSYAPLNGYTRARLWRTHGRQDLFYYGAYRAGRVPYFDRYLRTPQATISSTSKKFQSYADVHGATVSGGIARVSFAEELATHGLGLYIEDKRSHTEFHSPANRFYEMLGAGLPMVFQPECVPMMAEAGFNVRPYVLDSIRTVDHYMRQRERIRKAQYAAWNADYVDALRTTVRRQFKELTK